MDILINLIVNNTQHRQSENTYAIIGRMEILLQITEHL